MIWSRLPNSPLDRLASELLGIPVVGREVPKHTHTPTLYQACNARAIELATRPESEFLILLSGGADSTLAACALSRVLESAGKTVIYAMTATGDKDLDPITKQWLLDMPNASVRYIDKTFLDTYRSGFVITGILGDELTSGSAFLYGKPITDAGWQMSVDEAIGYIKKIDPSPQLTNRYIRLFEDMPYELNAPNMFHWLSFKYTWGREQLVLMVSSDIGIYGMTHTHFFDSADIQQWMMKDMRLRCGPSESTRKDIQIDVIREYIGHPVKVPQKNLILWEVISGTGNLYDVYKIESDGTIYREDKTCLQILR
jgi:hypothetical protein